MDPILFEISLGKKVETAGVLGMLSDLRLNFMKVGILSLFRGEIPPPVPVSGNSAKTVGLSPDARREFYQLALTLAEQHR
jgi:hypothetical protein